MAKIKLTKINKEHPVEITAKEASYAKKHRTKRNLLVFSVIINVISITYIVLTNLL